MRYATTVNTTVKANVDSVATGRSSTQFKPRPYTAINCFNQAPESKVSCSFFCARNTWAHSMGVKVSDTKAEIKMATAKVMANS